MDAKQQAFSEYFGYSQTREACLQYDDLTPAERGAMDLECARLWREYIRVEQLNNGLKGKTSGTN